MSDDEAKPKGLKLARAAAIAGAKEASSGQLALLYGGLGVFDLGLLFRAIVGTRLAGRAAKAGTH